MPSHGREIASAGEVGKNCRAAIHQVPRLEGFMTWQERILLPHHHLPVKYQTKLNGAESKSTVFYLLPSLGWREGDKTDVAEQMHLAGHLLPCLTAGSPRANSQITTHKAPKSVHCKIWISEL